MKVTLADVRRKIRGMMLDHEQSPPNEQQVRACLQELLGDLADVEASEEEETEAVKTDAAGEATGDSEVRSSEPS